MSPQYEHYSILIAEDDEEIRGLLTDALNKILNIKFVIEAADGIQASQRINNQKFDLIILDYKLPKRSGLEVLRSFKKEFKDQGTKILFISGYLDPTVLNKAVQLGIRSIMVKPFSADEFLKKIATIIKIKLRS